MIIYKTFKFRLYPTVDQINLLAQHFGACRFVYNHFLHERIELYASKKQSLTYNNMSKILTDLKKNPELVWLNGVNSQSLQQAIRHLDVAYNNFFNKRAQFPKIKSKHDKQSFHVPQSFKIDEANGHLIIPKITPIKTVFHRPIEGEMKSITISKTKTGKYFASILVETEKEVKEKKSGAKIGIDLGLKSFLVTSEGEKIDPPKFLRQSEKKLKCFQRRLSRKQKGGKNRAKARIKVARIHEKISNQRFDFLHKLSHRLVSESQAIFAEDLNVKGIMANHHLAKSVSDSGWSEFVRQLRYKTEWNGVHFEQIDRFFPSSKRCFSCGWINQSLSLKDREWTCKGCGTIIDRDLNSAQNILLFGLNSVRRDTSELKRPRRGGATMPLVEVGSRLL